MRQLDVYMNNLIVGRLSEDTPGKRYRFEYDPDYIKSNLPAISVLFPRSGVAFSSEKLFPFFVNMLPEGANKRMVCNKFKIDEKDNFGLLYHMADADFIGAVGFKQVL